MSKIEKTFQFFGINSLSLFKNVTIPNNVIKSVTEITVYLKETCIFFLFEPITCEILRKLSKKFALPSVEKYPNGQHKVSSSFSILDAVECARFGGVPITESPGYRACPTELMKSTVIHVINVNSYLDH